MNNASHSITIVRYTPELRQVWNDFVHHSKNGTFLVCRDYMEYHADRFADHSLLFYKGERLVALLPAHIQGGCFCSHDGLTYGGLILSVDATARLVLTLFEELISYLKTIDGLKKMTYRPIPHIYHRHPSEEDLYALFRIGASLSGRKIASVIEPSHALPFQTLRRRKVKRAQKEKLTLSCTTPLSDYWKILEETLSEKYGATPVHSLSEMERLQQLFPDNIKLFTTLDAMGSVIAGCLIYETDQVAHVQYIASTPQGRESGALDFLFDYLIHTHYSQKHYFDLGTSVEEGGRVLNEGLIFQKEGFGGRAVMYDMYDISLK